MVFIGLLGFRFWFERALLFICSCHYFSSERTVTRMRDKKSKDLPFPFARRIQVS